MPRRKATPPSVVVVAVAATKDPRSANNAPEADFSRASYDPGYPLGASLDGIDPSYLADGYCETPEHIGEPGSDKKR